MAEILERTEATVPDQDGWLCYYRVRRDDGEEVTVEAQATETAIATAENTGGSEALTFMADRGEAAALKYAEQAQSPAGRGKTLVRIVLDHHSGGLSVDYDYAEPPPGP